MKNKENNDRIITTWCSVFHTQIQDICSSSILKKGSDAAGASITDNVPLQHPEKNMQALMGLLHNQVLIATAVSWFIAQGGKMLLLVIKGEFTIDRLTSSGGMPSAHSATVTGLTVSTLIVYGTGSFEFVIALFFAIIVIYDAQGVRYTTGQQSRVLNRMRRRDQKDGKTPVQEQDLEEHMGHTLPELIAGILVGIAAACIVCALYR